MLKAWRKSCRKQYQHFKAPKDQCDAFNGGRKPFVDACWVLRVLRIVITLVWDWLIHGEWSPGLHPLLLRCMAVDTAVLPHFRGRDRVHSCWDMPALRCRGFNVWSRLNRVSLCRLHNWSAPTHLSNLIFCLRVLLRMFVHECFCRCHTYTLIFSTEWAKTARHTSESH